MTSKPPTHDSASSSLAEAIVASGLVKNARLPDGPLPKASSTPDSHEALEPASRRQAQRRLQTFDRPRSQMKPSIEEVVIDRGTHPPLPKLDPERPRVRDHSGSVCSESTDISFLYEPHPRDPSALSNEELLATFEGDEPITFPRVIFGAQTIGKSQLASRANYAQLSNLLHTMTAEVESDLELSRDDRIAAQKEAFDTVMSEVVRQGYFECSEKGELFQAVRSFMVDAVNQIPVLQKRAKRQSELAEQRISALVSESKDLERENRRLADQRGKLEAVQRATEDRLHFLEGKVPALEEEARNSRVLLVAADEKFRTVSDELKQVKDERDRIKSDFVRQSQLAEAVSDELQQMQVSFAVTHETVANLSAEIARLKQNCADIEAERSRVERLLELEIASHSPTAAVEVRSVETQTKAYARTIARVGPAPAPPAPTLSVAQIQELKGDYEACSETFGLSLHQFNQIKGVILARNGTFAIDSSNIMLAQAGRFELAGAPRDGIRLYVHSMMTRVMDHACRSVSLHEATTQTLLIECPRQAAVTQCQPFDLAHRQFGDAFTKLLDPGYADRPPRTFEWILKSLRSIYDEKTLKDAVDQGERRDVSAMPDFALQWATRQYGLNYLSHQCCWDLINSARAHRTKSVEVEMFRKFLDMDYSTSQLTFFLRIRANCLRRGITITGKSKETDDTFTETIMTGAHAMELVKKVFERAGQDVLDIAVRQLRDEFVRKPSPKVDGSVSYVPMSSLLRLCVESFAKYEFLELRKMMNCVQITPKLDGKQFRRLVTDLVPSLTDPEVSDLFRMMNAAQVGKVAIKKGKFRKQFRAKSLLSNELVASLEPVGRPSPELERARDKWTSLQPLLDQVLEATAKKGAMDPALSHEAQCLRVEMDQVSAALTCMDAIGAHGHILSSVVYYQLIRWVTSEPDPEAIDQLTDSIRGLLRI
jgi:hypothetical protein